MLNNAMPATKTYSINKNPAKTRVYRYILLLFIAITCCLQLNAADTLSLNGLFERVEQADDKGKMNI